MSEHCGAKGCIGLDKSHRVIVIDEATAIDHPATKGDGMRLNDLQPRWFDVPGVGTNKDGVTFICPCAKCQSEGAKPVRLGVQFANPVGGGDGVRMSLQDKLRHVHDLRTFDVPPGTLWNRTGDTFETMTLSPSIDASPAGHWHGFIRNGEIQ